jgi:squalene-associated FAD-dependent desaturase
LTATAPRASAAPRTVIVGGGLAGLAAAVTLADRGVSVTVLESRPRLGGRASSFVDKATGTQIDNCQHVSLGCCTNFQHFCRTVGLSDLFRTERALYFIGRDRVVNRLAAGALPAPLHLATAFAHTSYLSVRDLLAIGRGMQALARPPGKHGVPSHDEHFAAWLARHRQTQAAIDRFWMPVLVSSLSETLERIDVASARKVFVDGFLANRHGWEVQIPTVPLDTLYGARLTSWLAERAASVRLQVGVAHLAIADGRAAGVVLRSGETIPADHVVVAVPHWLVLDLLPPECAAHPDVSRVRELETAPISSVHLWFDRPILIPSGARTSNAAHSPSPTELPHAVLIDRLSQWIFNRDVLHADAAAGVQLSTEATPVEPRGHNYQVIISASRNIASASQQDVIAEVVRELVDVFPQTGQAKLLHGRLVTEHRAVFSVRPGAENCRPAQQSPLPNVQLAGDWTRTGWPSTMEGAVRSGFLAAENVLRQLGRAERIVQPDLLVAPLARLLLRIGSRDSLSSRTGESG